MNRYQNIMDKYPETGKKPDFLKEFLLKYPSMSESMVLKIKLLTPHGNYMEMNWSEVSAYKNQKESGE